MVNWPRLGRKTHYWVSLFASLPVLVIIGSGILLQLKKESTWIQPAEQRGSPGAPTVSFEEILNACKTVPEAEVETWDDIVRIDVRPSKGLIKVTAKNSWEIQLESASTGESSAKVLQVAYRRSDIIESIHDGSWFHDSVKLWIFLPAAILLLVLWITGMYLFVLPYWVRRRKRK